MRYQDLKTLQALCESKDDTKWLPIEHGVVCGLDKVLVMSITREGMLSLVAELFDHRARNLDALLYQSEDADIPESPTGTR